MHPFLYTLGLVIEGKHSFLYDGFLSSKPPARFPLWSVSDVLFFLVKGPGEPLEEATWPLLTMKEFFLVMLVSGRSLAL